MINLDAWLDANNPIEGAKWKLFEAKSISDTGWVIGNGVYDPAGNPSGSNSNRTFLLDVSSLVPEPGTLSLLIIGATLSLHHRRRRMNG